MTAADSRSRFPVFRLLVISGATGVVFVLVTDRRRIAMRDRLMSPGFSL